MDTIQKPHTTPSDFFINLGIIGVLYFVLINFLILAFTTIDYAFPVAISTANYIPEISFQLAALIVGFPLFLGLSRFMFVRERATPEKRELPVRKWLTYATLFVSGAVVLVDLVVLLKTFLGGEDLTIAFLLKVFVVFAVLALTFAYYLIDLFYKGTFPMRLFATLKSIAFVLLALGFGFYVFGSPATQRAKRFDLERVYNLQIIQSQVLSYWQTKNTVPGALGDLKDPFSGMTLPSDPKTGAQYEYTKVSATAFSLCATFESEGGLQMVSGKVRTVPVPEGGSALFDDWGHSSGHVCFDRKIDPEKYMLRK